MGAGARATGAGHRPPWARRLPSSLQTHAQAVTASIPGLLSFSLVEPTLGALLDSWSGDRSTPGLSRSGPMAPG